MYVSFEFSLQSYKKITTQRLYVIIFIFCLENFIFALCRLGKGRVDGKISFSVSERLPVVELCKIYHQWK